MAIRDSIPPEEAEILDAYSPLSFVQLNEIKNENGSSIEFVDHQFLIQPYMDMTPEQVIKKASQVGWSVLSVNKALWLPKYKQANVIYTLPSKSVVKDFVIPKVDPIIDNNPLYKSWISSTDSVALKKVGDRFLYLRGSWEQGAAISISAHILINDEYDRSNQLVVETYNTRLDDAKRERPDLGWNWKFSNPSIPGFGVDEGYEASDQKHWFIKCSHCGAKQFMSWPESINFERETYICKVCQKDLTDEDRMIGQWVARYPNRPISGYWINQMMCRWIPASKTIKDSKKDQSVFYNFTLGLAYISKDFSVTRKTITDCLSPDANSLNDVVMGVDNGVVKTVVIGNVYGIFKVYETESWEEIEEDIIKYNAYCVIDANPYPATPIKLAEKYKGRVFIHYFHENKKTPTVIEWGEKDKSHMVQSDRTKVIDMLVQELNTKEILFNLTLTQLEQYIFDWTQLFRTTEEDNKGNKRAVWRTIQGRRDHFAFATIYWRIALEKTFSGGGILRSPKKKGTMNRVVKINPDDTITREVDLKDIIRRSRSKKSWKTI